MYTDFKIDSSDIFHIGDTFIDIIYQNASDSADYLFHVVAKKRKDLIRHHLEQLHAKLHKLMLNMYKSKNLWQDRRFVETKVAVSESVFDLVKASVFRYPLLHRALLEHYVVILKHMAHVLVVICEFAHESYR